MTKTAKLIHNPKAGEGAPSKEELIKMVESAGFICSYLSVKEPGWQDAEIGWEDILIAAGGDGTVKKVVSLLLKNRILDQNIPIGLLPIGTANNIANALGISGRREDIIESWNNNSTCDYDLCVLSGFADGKFFIEGFGCGVFPYMVKRMKEEKTGNGYKKNRLNAALKLLLEIIPTYSAKYCHLVIDGKVYEGKFLMVEILNIPCIGPQLNLAPTVDPCSGDFEVVLVTEAQRDDFATYVADKRQGKKKASFFTTIKAKRVEIFSEETLVHVDDEILGLPQPTRITAELFNSPITFLK